MAENICHAPLRAELDAYFTRLYGLTRDELRYVTGQASLGNVPRAEGEGNPAIGEVQDETYSMRMNDHLFKPGRGIRQM